MGPATVPPCGVGSASSPSTTTAKAICGSSAGAKPTAQAFARAPLPVSAVPVFAATATFGIAIDEPEP